MGYRDVVDARIRTTKSIKETYDSRDDSSNVNSIVKLLSLSSSAEIPKTTSDSSKLKMNLILSQLESISDRINILQSANLSDKVCNKTRSGIFNIMENFSITRESHSRGKINDDDCKKYLSFIKMNLIKSNQQIYQIINILNC
jgi:hypothetical protein